MPPKKRPKHDPSQTTLNFAAGGLGVRRDVVAGEPQQRRITGFVPRNPPPPPPVAAPAPAPAAAPVADEEAPRFRVGDTVDVAPRTFPGINKAGGTGRITKVNDERSKDGGPMKDGSERRTTGFTYAVKYALSGSEKRVDAQWIARIDDDEDASDGGAAETLRTPGGRVATVIERRARGWVYVELDGNANDEGGAHERKSFRNSQLS